MKIKQKIDRTRDELAFVLIILERVGKRVSYMVGQKSVTQNKFPRSPRAVISSGASAASLALGRGRIMCGRFLRWIPRAILNLVASSPAVSELYWGKKALHVCMKIANLAPQLGRSTHNSCIRI